MYHSRSDYLRRLLLALDLLMTSLCYLLALRGYEYIRPGEAIPFVAHLAMLPIILISLFLIRGGYSPKGGLHMRMLHWQIFDIVRDISIAVAIAISFIFLLKLHYFSRTVLVSFFALDVILSVAVRILIHYLYFRGPRVRDETVLNILIVGSGVRARKLADILRGQSEMGINVVGFLDPRGESAGRRASDEIIGHANEISRVLQDSVVDEVIVAVPRSMLDDIQSITDACQEEGVLLRFMADIYDFDAARVSLAMVDSIPLLSFESVMRPEGTLLVKRIFDMTVTLIFLPVLIPVFLLVMLVIKLDSSGPALFVQQRVGLHKRRFNLYKFRSMTTDAEARLKDIEYLNEADGPNFKIKDDPRVTRVGRFLRKSSIDELPQLVNVFLGDMSLVGPRPMSVRDVDLFDKGLQRKRFSVRPGITCLWQISGRSDLSFDDWLKLDLEYIRKWTFWLDIKILFKTIPSVLKGSGAA